MEHAKLKLQLAAVCLFLYGIASGLHAVLPDVIMLYIWLAVLFVTGVTILLFVGALR